MSRICSKKVTHVIFDMDGVLLDTENLYTVATNNIVEGYGKTYNWTIKSQLMGLTPEESAKAIVDLLDLPITWQEYFSLAQEQYHLLMPHCNLMPDTEKIYAAATAALAKKYGKAYSHDLRVRILGLPGIRSAHILVKELELPVSIQQFRQQFVEYCRLRFHSCTFMPGAERLITHLYNNKVPIAVATSSARENVELKIAQHKRVFELFHHIVSGSDPEVKRGKPNPDIFLICASRFSDKPNPQQCVVIEDAPNGVTAAIKAGMQCIMVPDSQLPPELKKGANHVINSLEEIKLEELGLPALAKL